MLTDNQGQMLNAAQLASGLGVGGHTVARYLDIMVDLLLVRRLAEAVASLIRKDENPQQLAFAVGADSDGDEGGELP